MLWPDLVVIDLAPTAAAARVAPSATTSGSGEGASAVLALRLKERLATLRASGRYAFVEPDYVRRSQAVPSDTAFTDGTLWGLRNTGQASGTAGADIDAVRAWDLSTGSAVVIVGVIDSGIRYTHQELASRMWRNPGESGAGRESNGLDDDGDGYVDNVFGINAILRNGDPMDDNDHGTHCAGTIGAAAADGSPHVGVAWDVRLMALKFLGADGSGSTSDAIRCIDFAVGKGVRILSNSWGGGPFSQALFDAISRARGQGVLFIAAAGNETTNNDLSPSYPANYDLDNVISVAAIDRQDKLASFSNFGLGTVHLGAPGVSIYSSSSGSDTEYQTFSGTSMATPHVAGVAALLLSRFPGISLPELRARLLSTVVITPALTGKTTTGGRLNAFQALSATPDGTLELEAGSAVGPELTGGVPVVFSVRVTDLSGVNNATVTASLGGGAALNFANDGVAPDVTAGDFIYTRTLTPAAVSGAQTLLVTASAPGKTSITRDFVFTVTLPPANDAFGNAVSIAPAGGTLTGANRGANKQTGEPAHAGNAGGRSVWWQWTAAQSGSVTVRTAGSSFDTTLAVYTGGAVNALLPLASNDDVGGTLQSEVAFTAQVGVTYRIAIDGYNASSGDIVLALIPTPPGAPANDAFAAASALSGNSLNATGSNLNASKQAGEPAHAGNAGGKSVWWSWIAPATGQVSLGTEGSTFDTLLAVYTGAAVNALSVFAADDDSGVGSSSRLSFAATAGVTYRIAVDGKDGAFGAISLALELVTFAPPPINDGFSARLVLSGSTPSATGTNAGASRQAGEPTHAGNSGGRSVWWSWTAPASGFVTVSTAGSAFDTLLAVYSGTTLEALVPVAANDQSPQGGNTSQLGFSVTVGGVYQIAVDGANFGFGAASGAVQLALTLSEGGAGPVNDSFSAAALLVDATPSATGSNINATAEPGEPGHAGERGGGHSVWWRWTALESGLVTVRTNGSDFDTVLGIYTGAVVSALSLVGEDDDSGAGSASAVSFIAQAGVTYRIAVDGYEGSVGAIVLGLVYAGNTAPVNDAFAARTVLLGEIDFAEGTNFNATVELGEPQHARTGGIRSVWWSWTAPGTGPVSFDTFGSNFDTVLAVYTGSAVNALTLVAENDDDPLLDELTSYVSFNAVAGVRYQIAVDGYDGEQGLIALYLEFTGPILPVIIQQPTSLTVAPGQQAEFRAVANGSPAPTLRWQRSTNGAQTWVDLQETAPFSGTTSEVLIISSTSASANGHQFRARASNSAGRVFTNPATLRVGMTLAAYQALHFTAAEILNPAVSGPLADADGDGVVNLLEYAQGGNPRLAETASEPSSGLADGRLTLTYVRRTDALDLTYVVEHASSLNGAPWQSGPAHTQQISTTPLGGGLERITVRATASGAAQSFLRLRVNNTPLP